MSRAAPPAPRAKWPPFFKAQIAELPQSIFNPNHRLPPQIISQPTESAAQPPGKMCEYDSRKRGEVSNDQTFST